MTFSRLSILCVFTSFALTAASHAVPPAYDAGSLVGVWEMQTGKDLKTGQSFTKSDATWWFQFSKSHWMALQMARERKAPVPEAEFRKLSSEEKMKASHARIWGDDGQQLFAARGGTYSLKGDELHQTATLAIYSEIIGIDRVLKIVRLEKDTLVVRTEFADLPDVQQEWSFSRIE